jgi:ABC-type sugar transport system ATPase subunit
MDQSAGNLNVAQKKRLEMARALASRPYLLLLDEVLAGLNHSEIDNMVQTVLEIRKQGVTIIMIEHVMKAVMNVSDRVIVLDYGEQIAEGPPAQIVNDERVIEAYLGDPKLAERLLETRRNNMSILEARQMVSVTARFRFYGVPVLLTGEITALLGNGVGKPPYANHHGPDQVMGGRCCSGMDVSRQPAYAKETWVLCWFPKVANYLLI